MPHCFHTIVTFCQQAVHRNSFELLGSRGARGRKAGSFQLEFGPVATVGNLHIQIHVYIHIYIYSLCRLEYQ